MRFAVFVFSLLIIFAPTYANAILFLPAVKGAIIRTAGSQFVKVNSKRALVTAGVAYNAKIVYDYCKKTKKCDDIIENASELFGDDDTNADNDDFVCDGVVMYNAYQGGGAKKSGSYLAHAKNNFYDYAINLSKNNVPHKKPLDPDFRLDGEPYEINGRLNQIVRYNHYDFWGRETTSIIQVYKYCDVSQKPNDKEIETEINITKEQIQKIVNNMSDDDVTYIINNYGDEIDVDRYCSENSCDELSNEFAQEVQKNQNKYDIDKINKANCVVKNGKIVSCDKAKIEQDEEESTEEETTEESTEEETKESDEDKIDCDASKYHQKVCDFIDWYQSDDYEKQDNKIDIQGDDEQITQNTKIDFSGQCPPNFDISFDMLGQHIEFTLLETDRLCNFLGTYIKPAMIFLGALHAFWIVGRSDV